MEYSKEDIIAFWKEVIPTSNCDSTPIKNLKSHDYRSGHQICPKCKKQVYNLLRINGVWLCPKCSEVDLSKVKSLLAYKLANDMFEYFGEKLNSEVIFDLPLVKGFVRFTNLDKDPNMYLYYLIFLRTVLYKEFKGLTILNYLNRMEQQVNQLKKDSLKSSKKPKVEALAKIEETPIKNG